MALSTRLVHKLTELGPGDAGWAGSKATRLAAMAQAGLSVPEGVCIGTQAYARFLEQTGLEPRIQLLIGRKRFEDMRWEEIWDLALRIRNLFLRMTMPAELAEELRRSLDGGLAEMPVVVRSTALGEDGAGRSFAGLHDSFVDVRGVEAILDQVKLVWASLWSDRALLYRKELGLDPTQSAIAVVVQRLVVGRASGVLFTQSPTAADEAIIEAVWGLNQGLVDGTVAPDRWHLSRERGELRRHVPAERSQALRPGALGPKLEALDTASRAATPLQESEAHELWALGQRIEALFEAPQDVEWTRVDQGFVLLQARPITTQPATDDDKRPWYLSLHRSLESLRSLRATIEDEVLPGMDQAAADLAQVDLTKLGETALAQEIRSRQSTLRHWVDAYWRECIPFAHGVRLFGQIHNDHVQPTDPFEFVELLQDTELLASKRNAELRELGRQWSDREAGRLAADAFGVAADQFIERHGLALGPSHSATRAGLEQLLQQLTPDRAGSDLVQGASGPARRQVFLDRFDGSLRADMAELLELARASYRLRDDDNIYLGRVEAQVKRALEQARVTLTDGGMELPTELDAAQVVHALEDPTSQPEQTRAGGAEEQTFELRARQLVGQPASPGLAVGLARVVRRKEELFAVQRGEVLVCDSLDPTMTLVAPLVAGIIERRGGMLIHGAIIAREYGVPCVTGVPDVLSWITTGETVTVDGHVGLVTIARTS